MVNWHITFKVCPPFWIIKSSRYQKLVYPVWLWRQHFLIGPQPSLLFFRFISATPPGWLGGQLTPPQYTLLHRNIQISLNLSITFIYTAYISIPNIYLHPEPTPLHSPPPPNIPKYTAYISLIPHIYLHSLHLINSQYIPAPGAHISSLPPPPPNIPKYTAYISLIPHIYLHSLHLINPNIYLHPEPTSLHSPPPHPIYLSTQPTSH